MKTLALIVPLLFCGCISSPSDRAAFQALKPAIQDISTEYMNYVNADPDLVEAQKLARQIRTDEILRLLEEKTK